MDTTRNVRDVAVNELLCYMTGNFGKVSANQLKSAVVKFYKDDEIVEAKETLIACVDKVADKLLPRFPKRKGEQKNKLSVDDLYDIFTLIDENKLTDTLPLFAAVNLSRLPLFKIEDVDVFTLATKMDLMETRLSSLDSSTLSVVSLAAKLDAIDAKILPVLELVNKLNSARSFPPTTIADTMQGSVTGESVGAIQSFPSSRFLQNSSVSNFQGNSATASDASVVRSAELLNTTVNNSVAHANITESRNLPNSWADIASGVSAQNENTFTVVENRRAPARQATQVSGNMQSAIKNTKRKQVIGTMEPARDSTIKSGIKIVKKAVVHVDNMCADCSPEDLCTFLTTNNIPVLSCFTAKSWLRNSERNQVSAFRVCVEAVLRDKLESPNMWPEGVLIRDWIFKSTKDGSNV
jgi:hypothetical protein